MVRNDNKKMSERVWNQAVSNSCQIKYLKCEKTVWDEKW